MAQFLSKSEWSKELIDHEPEWSKELIECDDEHWRQKGIIWKQQGNGVMEKIVKDFSGKLI